MFEWVKSLVTDSNLLTVVFTLLTIVIASIKNWFIAESKLKTTYYLMIILGLAYIGLNTSIALHGSEQKIVLLMNIPALWTSIVGIKGLVRLKRGKNESYPKRFSRLLGECWWMGSASD